MSTGLYRPSAVQALALNEQLGRTLMIPTNVTRLAALGALAVLATLIGVAYGFSYEARTTVSGFLEPVAGEVAVQTPQAGIIRSLLVTEGSQVKQGDLLFALDTTTGTRKNAHQEELIAASYREEIANLEALSLLNQRRSRLEAELLSTERNTVAAKLTALTHRHDAAEKQRSMRNQHVAGLQPLTRSGLLAASELTKAKEALHEIDGTLAGIEMERATLEGRRTSVGLELQRLANDAAIEGANLSASRKGLYRRLLAIAPQIEVAVRAPVDGIVSAPRVVEGERVADGTAVMGLLGSTELRAVLMAPPHAAGSIDTGQSVQVRYDAFAYEKYGVQQGIVQEVSATTLRSPDATAYRILVALQPNNRFPHLRPGMTLRADLLHDRRRLYEWLLAPALKIATTLDNRIDG